MIILLGRLSLHPHPCPLPPLPVKYTTPSWPGKFLQRNQLIALWVFPFKWLFLLLLYNSLPLTFVILIMICLGMGLSGFILFGTFWPSCPRYLFTSLVGIFLAIISSNTFVITFPVLLKPQSCISWHILYHLTELICCFRVFFISWCAVLIGCFMLFYLPDYSFILLCHSVGCSLLHIVVLYLRN